MNTSSHDGNVSSLVLLEQLLSQVYWPVISNASSDVRITDTLKNEFLGSILYYIHMHLDLHFFVLLCFLNPYISLLPQLQYYHYKDVQKFSTQISHTIQQVNGEVTINIPNIHIVDPIAAADDQEVLDTAIYLIFQFLMVYLLLLLS